MKKNILIIFGILTIGIVVFYIRSFIPRPAAGIAYTGYVKINHLSLTDIEAKLKQNGCIPYERHKDYLSEETGLCGYHEVMEVPAPGYEKEKAINVWFFSVKGPGWFFITEDKIWANELIPGSSNQNEFEESVRQAVRNLGNVVQIQENSWKVEAKKYYSDTMFSI